MNNEPFTYVPMDEWNDILSDETNKLILEQARKKKIIVCDGNIYFMPKEVNGVWSLENVVFD